MPRKARSLGWNPCGSLGAFICIYLHSFACLAKLQGHWVRLGGLWSLWQVFSVFGVTLFGAFVPKHFQNMGVALYTLFICITQDGWLDIYSDFQ